MNIRIERPTLNRPTPQENIAVIDRWIADTTDKLNAYFEQMDKEMEGVNHAGNNQITS